MFVCVAAISVLFLFVGFVFFAVKREVDKVKKDVFFKRIDVLC